MVDEERNTTLHYARYGRMANNLIYGVLKKERKGFCSIKTDMDIQH